MIMLLHLEQIAKNILVKKTVYITTVLLNAKRAHELAYST